MGRVVLVLGGTKSGKTQWAQNRALKCEDENSKNVAYIATAQAFDEGMKERIRKHRENRPEHWITFEECFSVSSILLDTGKDKAAVILDCLTVLSSNILFRLGEDPDRNLAQEQVLTEVSAILDSAAGIEGELIIVSNHVEEGLVAPTRLGGIFQDIAGLSHQMIAERADEVFHIIAGIPNRLK